VPNPNNRLELKAWQVVGVDWMMAQEAGPIQGGIVADDCRLGKTIQTLAHVWFASHRQEPPYRPTLIVVPPNLIDTWLDEFRRHFVNLLTLLLYQGVTSGTPDERRKDYMVEGPNLQARLAALSRTDPETSRTVVLTSYTTWAMRTLRVVDKREYEAIQGQDDDGKEDDDGEEVADEQNAGDGDQQLEDAPHVAEEVANEQDAGDGDQQLEDAPHPAEMALRTADAGKTSMNPFAQMPA
jgi:SNF2 family DNA or RNA helicase